MLVCVVMDERAEVPGDVIDAMLEKAVDDVDESLIALALERSPLERLRAGVAGAHLMVRFDGEASEGR